MPTDRLHPDQPFFDLADRYRLAAPTLSEVVYVSRRASDFTDSAVVNMVIEAGVRNYLAGVSGRLWHSRQFFLQVLEGTHQTLEPFISKIRADARHRDFHIISRRRLDIRRFDRPICLFHGDEDISFRDFIARDMHATRFDDACAALYPPAAPVNEATRR